MNTGKLAKGAQSPLKKFAYASTVSCLTHASVYGKCITAKYTDTRKDMCKEEFAKFAKCLRATVSLRVHLNTSHRLPYTKAKTQVVMLADMC